MKQLLWSTFLLLTIGVYAPAVSAQGTVRTGPDPATLRDPELEKDSMHNLEVARNYFKLKKAYVAALKRTEEIIAGNPTFTRIDEALFMAGSSCLFLAEKKGKQAPSLYISYEGNTKKTLTAEEFREMGRDYLSQLIDTYPDSGFRGPAEEALRNAGVTKKQ